MKEKSYANKDSSIELVKDKYKKAVEGGYSVILSGIEKYMKDITNARQTDMADLLRFFIITAQVLRDIDKYEEKMYKDIIGDYKLDKDSINELKRFHDSVIDKANLDLTAILSKYSVVVQLKSDQNEKDHLYI
ncbi:MAG: hypothetical protein QXV17_13840 [Candidatus Micrarchaeaceae archaeon]